MTTPASPVAARRRLAAALRQARGAAGRSLEQAAGALECSVAKISRIETAMVGVRVQDVRELAAYYGHTADETGPLLDLARTARGRGWWDRWADMLPDQFVTFIGLEDEASDVWTWEPSLIPGLLQTPGYARAVMEASGSHRPDLVERGIELRLARQRTLTRDGGPALWAVVDESALRRPPGGAGAWAGQLRALLAAPGNVTVQILPLAAGLAAEGTAAFTVLGFPPGAGPRVAYTESPHDAHLVDDAAGVGEYLMRFDRLHAAALDVAGSADLILAALRTAEPG